MEPIKILVADDEPNIVLLIEMLFQEMGYQVVKASNGEEAIQLAQSEKPDLIVTDVLMPKKSGFEVCKTIRSLPQIADTPIIILSAMGDEYNKITGFDGGADDYITKPFSAEELKARTKALLHRHKPSKQVVTPEIAIETFSTGISGLDQCLGGGLPRGANILVMGPTGKGKSSFSRQFLVQGLRLQERCLFVAIDDNPQLIRNGLSTELNKPIKEFETLGLFRLVDAYSWSTLTPSDEPFTLTGSLDLNQLSGAIADAGFELGQTIQHKLGGRRVVDSISSLFVHFDLSSVQRFLNQITRTAVSFGGVTTLYLLEEGAVSEQMVNAIKYTMDGVIEFSEQQQQRVARVASMKWAKYNSVWVEV